MKTCVRGVVMALALAVGVAAVAAAQRPQTRQGFWINFGFGYGSSGVSCDGCGSLDREGGGTGHLRMGGTVSPKFLLGGEVDAWVKDEQGVTVSFGTAAAAAYFYPMVQQGLFFKGGLGYSSVTVEALGASVDDQGFGLILGGGYDIRVGRNISIVPEVSFNYGIIGDFAGVTGFKQNFFDFSLGITFH